MPALEREMAGGGQDLLTHVFEQYSACQERYEALDRYSHAAKITGVLAGLGIAEERWDRPVGMLSGGEKKMVGLARLLIDPPDVLLLDEPDNHLDVPSCEELESALLRYDGTIATISHDRYFLDKVVDRIIEIDDGVVRDYPGSFSYYDQHRGRGAELTIRIPSPVGKRQGVR